MKQRKGSCEARAAVAARSSVSRYSSRSFDQEHFGKKGTGFFEFSESRMQQTLV
jgi:hypothetical protein